MPRGGKKGTSSAAIIDWFGNHVLAVDSLFGHLFTILGGILAFIPQYAEIQRTQITNGFSFGTSFTTLISKSTHLTYSYMAKDFDDAYVTMSKFLVIIVMLLQMDLILKINRSKDMKLREISILANPSTIITSIWQWTDIASYIIFLVVWVVLLLTTFFIFNTKYTLWVILLIAYFFEVGLIIPQLILNWKKKRVCSTATAHVNTLRDFYSLMQGAWQGYLTTEVTSFFSFFLDLIHEFQCLMYHNHQPDHKD